MSSDASSVSVHQVHPEHEIDARAIEHLVRQIGAGEGQALKAVSVVLADHARVLHLNREYLGHDYHTDVLSFNLGAPEGEGIEGEVYVDLDTAAERHREFETTFEAEALRYVAHGVLHLMGYDDASEEGEAAMRALENRYLQRIDLPE